MNTDSDHFSGNNPTRISSDVPQQSSIRRRSRFTLLNRYEVQAPLGSGGMRDGAVAKDRSLERQVAIRWIRGNLAQSEQAIQRFYKKAKAAAVLNHPNIVRIYDRGSDE